MKKFSIRFLTIICFISTLLVGISFSQNPDLDEHAFPFSTISDFDPLMGQVDNQKLVLMGEASHGTSEFYIWRGELSKRLITEKGFNFIAVEGDWPALSKVNEFVKHKPNAPETIEEAMAHIERWPTWMWRNMEVKELLVWLHDHNSDLEPGERVGFYGVDLYEKRGAMRDVIHFFEDMNSDLASEAESAYNCITQFDDVRNYIRSIQRTGDDCSQEVRSVLGLVQQTDEFQSQSWAGFNAGQNAELVINAEKHYRGNLLGGAESWNARASHFYQTAQNLLQFYGDDSRGIIWAHNTHIGDARATDMARQGAVNIGQLAKEDLGEENVFAIGFGTYQGEVLAAREWEGRMEAMETPPAQSGSWEDMLNNLGHDKLFLLLDDENLQDQLQSRIPHRAIGVTFNPRMERNNYVPTVLPQRYNAFIFFRETGILNVLD